MTPAARQPLPVEPPRVPDVSDALQYADGLPADCWADRCIIELASEVVRLRALLRAAGCTIEGEGKL